MPPLFPILPACCAMLWKTSCCSILAKASSRDWTAIARQLHKTSGNRCVERDAAVCIYTWHSISNKCRVGCGYERMGALTKLHCRLEQYASLYKLTPVHYSSPIVDLTLQRRLSLLRLDVSIRAKVLPVHVSKVPTVLLYVLFIRQMEFESLQCFCKALSSASG